MDIFTLLDSIDGKLGSMLRSTFTSQFASTTSYEPIYILVVSILTTILIIFVIIFRRWDKKVIEKKESVASSTRFRKRDKALFYGRKMLRKVRSISGQVRSGQGRKRKMVMKFARRILQLKKDNEAEQLKVLEPPAEYLQEDTLSDERMPPDLLYMLQSVRVFGHFEKPIFLRLCKHTEIITVKAGAHLFNIGDQDENVYIVQNGKVNVYITNPDGSALSLKVVKTGESVTSLLSFIDVLTGQLKPYKTVAARALEDSTIVKLPMKAFNDIFQDNPEILVRVVQVIMVRLQRVTFTALHEYLGLGAELFISAPRARKSHVFVSPSKKMKSNDEFDIGSSAQSQPIPVPVNKNQKSTSPLVNTPDMIPEYKKGELRATPPNNPDMIPDTQKLNPEASKRNLFEAEEGTARRKMSMSEITDETVLHNIAMEAFIKELGLEGDTSSLIDGVEVKEVTTGTYIMKEDSNKDVALVYVLSGSMIVSQSIAENDANEVSMYTAHSGEFVGGLAVLTGEPSYFTVRAKHNARIGLISKPTFYNLVKENPKIILHVANLVISRLSPFVRQVDFALDWVFHEAGRAVYRQDDDSDTTFVVLSGRMRSVITHNGGKKELVAEYGKGDLIGIVEMVTHTKRSTTVIAVRDSELAKLPEGLFNAIKMRYPIVVTRLINLLGLRILGTWQNPNIKNLSAKRITNNATVESRPTQLNFSTVAIVPASDDIPMTAFTYELFHCLNALGATSRLTSDVVKKALGSSIMDPNNEYRLTSWLAQQEDQHKICLYQCDNSFSVWTQRCIRQADCILIVGLGDKEPIVGRMEREIERVALRTQKELVLLHREEGGKPQNTVAWLNMRSWVSSHHHILCPKRMFSRKSLYRINELYSKVCLSEPNIHSDYSRLARWLTGKSVGLVLGGGGARGSAHIGMIKSIIEAGIPIDMVGGVSIGAFMGALWCKERNITTVTQMAREWSKKMTQWWRQLLDLTYPMTSMFSGRDFNQTIRGTFGETYIEDLWLPYFTVTTDISASCMRVHHHGSLWRYVRSSMSLSGYMPPLCDPVDGHLLLDGGYVNNLPADVMRSQGASHIIAIDVGSVDDQDLTNYGDDLSGWWLLWKRWYPFTQPVKVPNLPDIQSRLAYVSCVRQLEEVKTSDYCEYIRPPIDKYKTLQFGSFDEIKEVGYLHGKAYFDAKQKAGQLPLFASTEPRKSHLFPQRHVLSGYTFTDLAQMVCKIRRPYEDESSNSDSDDYDENDENRGYVSEPSVGINDNTNKEYDRPYGSLSLSENEM
ncbi:PREDICTED: neuropathy target esterase sws isoform X1 [Nicrophorus vespilloides]|uniref:Neuropathy target esterase sws n=1 Tax=Nicrophorus vespilloides TaxID=110193 RepID=A0ABM1M679_NICVS|nr:PREDICTED: neuropathy target esterase sws isoform X1 [Nicrophorus vespilloides]